MLLFLTGDFAGVEVPAAISLGGVDELAAVGVEIDAAFLLGAIGNAAGRLVLDGGDKDFATGDEGDLFSIGRCSHLGDVLGEANHLGVHLFRAADGDLELARFGVELVLHV